MRQHIRSNDGPRANFKINAMLFVVDGHIFDDIRIGAAQIAPEAGALVVAKNVRHYPDVSRMANFDAGYRAISFTVFNTEMLLIVLVNGVASNLASIAAEIFEMK